MPDGIDDIVGAVLTLLAFRHAAAATIRREDLTRLWRQRLRLAVQAGVVLLGALAGVELSRLTAQPERLGWTAVTCCLLVLPAAAGFATGLAHHRWRAAADRGSG
jgi:uncharacterized membrane protein YdfJ with MMPL/SSD domain